MQFCNFAIFDTLTDGNQKEKPYLCQLVTNNINVLMILISNQKKNAEKDSAVAEKSSEIRKEFDISVPHKSFFGKSLIIDKKDKEEKKIKGRKEYKDEKNDPDTDFIRLIDHDKQIELIWDGKKEHRLEIGKTDATQRRFISILIYLNTEGAKENGYGIKHRYDYAWIYKAIVAGLFMGSDKLRFSSVSDYVRYVHDIVVKESLSMDVGDSDNINHYLNTVTVKDNSPSYKFKSEDEYECPFIFNRCDKKEANRRIGIVEEFVKMMDPRYN